MGLDLAALRQRVLAAAQASFLPEAGRRQLAEAIIREFPE
jgi:hypothetical protein